MKSFIHKVIWLVLAFVAAAAAGMSHGAARETHQSHESIRERAQQFLLQQLHPSQRADARIEIGRLDPRLRLRQCTAPLQASVLGGRARVGATSVAVRCEDGRPWTLYVTARVVVFGEVLVAARALRRGETLHAGDLRRERRDLSRLPYGYLSEAAEAEGKVLQRSYLAGQAVQPNHLEAPLLVKRGQQVTLHARTDSVEIRMAGEALSDGAQGERIRVRNHSSDRIVEGEVVAKGVVRVRI